MAGGARLNDKLLTVVSKASTLPQARLGLAISSRNVPRAVDRNRIKRSARESFREHRERLPARDLVILARPGAAKASTAELRTALEKLWQGRHGHK